MLSLSGALVNTLWTRPVRLAICFSMASMRSRRWSLQTARVSLVEYIQTRSTMRYVRKEETDFGKTNYLRFL